MKEIGQHKTFFLLQYNKQKKEFLLQEKRFLRHIRNFITKTRKIVLSRDNISVGDALVLQLLALLAVPVNPQAF